MKYFNLDKAIAILFIAAMFILFSCKKESNNPSGGGSTATDTSFATDFFYSKFGQPPPYLEAGEYIVYALDSAKISSVSMSTIHLLNMTSKPTVGQSFVGATSGAVGTFK